MNRTSSLDVDEPYNIEGYVNFVETYPASYVRKSSRPRSKSPMKKPLRNNDLRNTTPLSDDVPDTKCTPDFNETQLPHYVVPVLYIPQRIITNEELYASEIYNKDFLKEKVYDERPQQVSRQFIPENYSYEQKYQDDASVHRSKPSTPHNHLTDSETYIYDELMAKLYGMEQPEEEIAVENDFHGDYDSSINGSLPTNENVSDGIHGVKKENNPQLSNQTQNVYSENSTASMRSQYNRRPSPLNVKPTSYTQEYASKTKRPRTPSAYTVYPIDPTDYVLNKPVKGQIPDSSRTCASNRESSLSRNARALVAASIPLSRESTAGQAHNMLNSTLIFREVPSESKCTQTTTDMFTDTENRDYNLYNSFDYIQKVEKRTAKNRTNSKSLNCSDADVTLIIDRGSDENIYTVLGSGSQFASLQDSKYDKPTDCFATVDLLPMESEILPSVLDRNIMPIPKLRTHSRNSNFFNLK